MTAQTKMIIITSDENIIRQFAMNKPKNTQIIDLDDEKLETSIDTNDTNIVNMALLAELSKLSSNNDQVYKRALDSPDQNPPKSVKISRKSTDMICVICGDHAIGFNYDALSCASCKAFFRRNANQNMENIRCLRGQGQCAIEHTIRRKCQKCRLERCFTVGMRKDFLQSEEEKQQRRKRVEENRKIPVQHFSTTESSPSDLLSNLESHPSTFDDIDRILMNMNNDEIDILFDENAILNEICDTSLETLSVEDWITIESLRSSFTSIFAREGSQHPSIDVSDRTSALISWSYVANQTALRIISFCRQIPEFEGLHIDDRLILIKYNIFPVYPVIKCLYYNPINHCCVSGNDEEVATHQRFYNLCFGADGTGEGFFRLVISIYELTEQDPAMLSLLLIILMFYQGLSTVGEEPSLTDSLVVYRAQSYYTTILWKYMSNKWDEENTWKRFTQLLTIMFRMQSTAKIYFEYFRAQLSTSDVFQKLAPLMQTVLHIS